MREGDFWRWELRITLAIPAVLLLLGLAFNSLAVELAVRAVAPGYLPPLKRVFFGQTVLWFLVLASLTNLIFGVLLAVAIIRPVRRTIQAARVHLRTLSAPPSIPATVNELAQLTDAVDQSFAAFDRLVADRRGERTGSE